MNHDTPTHQAQFCARQMLADAKDFAQREPLTTAAAALGFGILLNLLPTRALVATAAVVGGIIVRPVLLSLGVAKALELCCQNPSTPSNSNS